MPPTRPHSQGTSLRGMEALTLLAPLDGHPPDQSVPSSLGLRMRKGLLRGLPHAAWAPTLSAQPGESPPGPLCPGPPSLLQLGPGTRRRSSPLSP